LTQLRELDPDVIFLSLVHPEAALMRVQGSELGIETEWLVGAGGAEDAFATVAGDDGVTTYSYQSTRVPDRFAAFAETYEEAYGRPPGNFNDYTYDGANVLLSAIEAAGEVDYAAIVAELEGIEYDGVTGPISFDDTGSRTAEQYEVIAYGDDHEWAVVEDVPFSTPE
jgi:branched-chain amino acid transport system substrate-binding protein